MYIHEPACFYKLHFFNTKSCMLYYLHNKQNVVGFYNLRYLLDMSTWCHRNVLQALTTLKPTRKIPHPLHARGTTLLTTVLNSCHNIFGNCISLSRQEHIHSCILLCYYCQFWLVLRSYYRKPVWYIVWKDTFFFFFLQLWHLLKKTPVYVSNTEHFCTKFPRISSYLHLKFLFFNREVPAGQG